jgi:hypothetical protein
MHFTKDSGLRDHASERERLLIGADNYRDVLGDLPKAAEAYIPAGGKPSPRRGRTELTGDHQRAGLGQYETGIMRKFQPS